MTEPIKARGTAMKVIIDIKDETPFFLAAACVDRVIQQGRISDGGRSYCGITAFKNSVCVAAFANKNSDRFVVWTDKNNEDSDD